MSLPQLRVPDGIAKDTVAHDIAAHLVSTAGAHVLPFIPLSSRRIANVLSWALAEWAKTRPPPRGQVAYPLSGPLGAHLVGTTIDLASAEAFRRTVRVNGEFIEASGTMSARPGITPGGRGRAEARIRRLKDKGKTDGPFSRVLDCATIGSDGSTRPFDGGDGEDYVFARSIGAIPRARSAWLFLDAIPSEAERERFSDALRRGHLDPSWSVVASGPLCPYIDLDAGHLHACGPPGPSFDPRWESGVALSGRLGPEFIDDTRQALAGLRRALLKHGEVGTAALRLFFHVLTLLDTAHFGHEGLLLGSRLSTYGLSPDLIPTVLDDAVDEIRSHSKEDASRLAAIQHRIVQVVGAVAEPSSEAPTLIAAIADAATRPKAERIALVAQSYQQAAPLVMFVARALNVPVGDVAEHVLIPLSAIGFRRTAAHAELLPWREIHVINSVDQETLHLLSLHPSTHVVFHTSERGKQRMVSLIEARKANPALSAFSPALGVLVERLHRGTTAPARFSAIYDLAERSDTDRDIARRVARLGADADADLAIVFYDGREIRCSAQRSFDVLVDRAKGNVEEKYARELRPRDEVILVAEGDSFDLNRRILTALSASPVWGAYADIVAAWRQAVSQSYLAQGADFADLVRKLRLLHCPRQESTIQRWIAGHVWAPKEHADIERLSEALSIWQDRKHLVASTVAAVSALKAIQLRAINACSRMIVATAVGHAPDPDDGQLLAEAGIDEGELIDAAVLRTVASIVDLRNPQSGGDR